MAGSRGRSIPCNDPIRDDLTLPLIRKAVEAGVPLLAICPASRR